MANFGGNGPIDYSSMIQQPDFAGSIAQGYQLGAGIKELQQKQIDREMERNLARQYQTDLQDYFTNPTAPGAAQLMAKYPKQSEPLQKAFSTLEDGEKNQQRELFGQFNAAGLAGRGDLQAQIMNTHIEALKNSGKPVPPLYPVLADLAATDPKKAQSAAFFLHAGTDPKHFDSTILTSPAAMKKADAEANTAVSDSQIKAAEAGNAPTKIVLANQNDAEDIFSKQNKREIDRLNVEIRQANSETQRGELLMKRDELIAKQNEKTQDKSLAAQDQMDGLATGLSTVKELIDHPGLSTGSGLGSSVMSFFNGTDAKDFRVQLETLKSQQFLTTAKQLKGMGALSDAEGARLEKATASLDPNQSNKAMRNALGVIQATLKKAEQKLIAEGKLPKSGGAVVQQVPGIGNVTEGDINRLLALHPGSTREQAIQYLQTLGRK